jgi:hypothetical protein
MAAKNIENLITNYNFEGSTDHKQLYKAILDEIFQDEMFTELNDEDKICSTLIFIRNTISLYSPYLQEISKSVDTIDINYFLKLVSDDQAKVSELLQSENIKSIEELVSLKKQHAELTELINSLEVGDVIKMQNEVDEYKKQVAGKENELKKLKKELKGLKESLEKHAAENESVFESIRQTEYFKKFANANGIESVIAAIKSDINTKLNDYDCMIKGVVESREKIK